MVVLLYLISLSYAGVVKDDVSVSDRVTFSWKSVCSKMVTHEAPLIEPVSGTEIDCMGKTVNVSDFCEKEMAHDPYFLRGYVREDSQEVICQSGKKVIFKYQCVRLADKRICSQLAEVSCKEIRNKLARRLDIVHHSFTKNEKGIKELNCYFESLPRTQNGTL
jgi:ribosomal protein S17E